MTSQDDDFVKKVLEMYSLSLSTERMAFLRAPKCVPAHVANTTCTIEVPKIEIRFEKEIVSRSGTEICHAKISFYFKQGYTPSVKAPV
jgi:hypothetical protein